MPIAVRRVNAPDPFNPFDFDFFVDGAPLGSSPSFRRTNLSDDLMFTDAQTELNILVTALRLSGTTPAVISKRESPDFEIHVVPNDTFYVEITTVIEPIEAQADNRIIDISQAITKWAYETPSVDQLIQGFALTFFIPFPPRATQEAALIEELKRFTVTEPLRASIGEPISSVRSEYTLLSSLGCKVLVLASGTPLVQVSRGAMSIAPPTVGVAQVASCIQRKMERARSWASKPVWLVVWLTAIYAWNEGIIDSLQADYKPPDTANPFNRIIVGDGRSIVIYDIT